MVKYVSNWVQWMPIMIMYTILNESQQWFAIDIKFRGAPNCVSPPCSLTM